MTILLFFFLITRILLFDSNTCQVNYSSVLIAHSFNFILCMKIPLFYFLPTRNLSFEFHACHVSYFSFLIDVPFIPFVYITILLLFFIPPWGVSFYFHACHASFFCNCSFPLFRICTWHLSYFAVFFLEQFHLTSMHKNSLIFSINFSLLLFCFYANISLTLFLPSGIVS
jgi:hypothetical protein